MTSYVSNINRLQSEIARLHKDEAALASKEAALLTKANRAREAIGRTKSTSTIASKLKEIERATHDLADIGKKRAALSARTAAKTKDLNANLAKQATEDERARKKVAQEQSRLIKQRDDHARQVTQQLAEIARTPTSPTAADQQFDFFISHASEDKEDFVRPLARELEALGAVVFYDEKTMKVGDSLRRSIDAGLSNSRFGIVVLSTAFFKKEWPAKELGGLTALEVSGQSKILPIWHKVTKDEVSAYSPTLTDKVALNSSLQSVKEIASELMTLL